MASNAARNDFVIETSRIPATVRIGVTGHRKLNYDMVVREKIRGVLAEIDRLMEKKLPRSPRTFIAVSPLAEGADTLVAEEVLAWRSGGHAVMPSLEVILPMPVDQYLSDFETQAAIDAFKRLLARARAVKVVKDTGSRKGNFEEVGRAVVHNCDVLIAIWDGRNSAGRGGTADIVDYARKMGHAIVWIHSDTGAVQKDNWDEAALIRPLKYLDVYNGERLSAEKIDSAADKMYKSFLSTAGIANMPESILKPFRDDLLIKYERASLLSKKYQAQYMRAGSAIYGLSAAAIGVVAIQALFFPGHPELVWLEFLFMLLLLAQIFLSSGRQRKWSDYRFLAERMRAAIFFTIAGIRYEPLRYPPYLSRADQSDCWIVKAFSWIWNSRPRGQDGSGADFTRLSQFLKSAWLEDQAKFYARRAHELKSKYELYETIGTGLFVITFIAAFLHASGIAEHVLGDLPYEAELLTGVGFIFPALGAALAGMLTNREYLRIAERYSQMVEPLKDLLRQMEIAEEPGRVVELLEEANELMLRENQNWRFGFLTQKLRPP